MISCSFFFSSLFQSDNDTIETIKSYRYRCIFVYFRGLHHLNSTHPLVEDLRNAFHGGYEFQVDELILYKDKIEDFKNQNSINIIDIFITLSVHNCKIKRRLCRVFYILSVAIVRVRHQRLSLFFASLFQIQIRIFLKLSQNKIKQSKTMKTERHKLPS